MKKSEQGHRRGLVVCITGASRGIGNAIARELAPSCADILITSKHKRNLAAAARGLKESTSGRVHSIAADLAWGRRAATAIARRLSKISNSLDVLVLNAGYYVEGKLTKMSDQMFERNVTVNFMSTHYLVSALMPFLRRGKTPRIIIIGSTAAYEPYPIVPTYGVAKWGLRGYAINLRKELVSDRIGVTFVAPGGTLTDMWKGVRLPKDRLLDPTDIAKLIKSTLSLSSQAVVEEIIVRSMQGDIHE